MRELAEYTLSEGDQGGAATLALRGPLRVYAIGKLERDLETIDQPLAKIDLSEITEIDTTGAWVTTRFAARHDAEIVGADENATRLLKAVSQVDEEETETEAEPNVVVRSISDVGDRIVAWGHGLVDIVTFLGALMAALGSVIRHPSRMRWTAMVHHMQYIGINSLWIVGLMSFLIGIVIAQQGAVQLAQFGAEIYTINLTGRLSMRELGILMTAIMVAGRSGSAFAAQIGTMQLTEEVDAMRTIGVAPMETLVVPRVLASMVMMPLLGFYSAVLAIVGGAFISNFALDIPFLTFLQRIQEVVPITDVWVGLIKAPVFALVIALAGCYHGMQVKGNAEEVGLRTTQSVVTAIFTVIVIDAFFAIFFTEIGWA
ncbi:ABC transporter permease [Novosphingobium aquimarinum]|uniref:ABC transporter permease n=1 Tax=Novosphingobium aquimarinum TaxID=2682494 RepID=UPI0012EC2465|nr:ABC transporter permease [Novosphingobium aquimarinum]